MPICLHLLSVLFYGQKKKLDNLNLLHGRSGCVAGKEAKGSVVERYRLIILGSSNCSQKTWEYYPLLCV